MIIYSDKINCYIEGIRIPITSIDVYYFNNAYSRANMNIALGETIIPQAWANALIIVSYISNSKEKLFFQGLISGIEIIESESYIKVEAESGWSGLNLNTTFDYVAPKKYGIQDVENDITIYLGNEETIKSDNGDVGDNYHLSNRYFFLKNESDTADRKVISQTDSEAYKLQYIGDRTPFAELFGFNILEQMAYKNFLLTEAYSERLNLLNKVNSGSIRGEKFRTLLTEIVEETITNLELDIERTGISYKRAKNNIEEMPLGQTVGGVGGTAVPGKIGCLTYPALDDNRILQKIKDAYTKYKVHAGFQPSMIMVPCKSLNVNPMLIVAIAQQESLGGTLGRGATTHNPGNVGNVDDGTNSEQGMWEKGWIILVKNIARRMSGWGGSAPPALSIENLCGFENGKRDERRPIYATQSQVWITNVSNNFNNLNGCEGSK